MSKKNLIVVIVLVIIVGVGAVVWMLRPPANQTDNTKPNTTSNTSSSQSTTTITYTDSGFTPSSITVHSGDTITLKNTSSESVQFDSDPHPVHTDDPELNAGAVSPGGSTTFTVSTKGTHGYHNHLNPAQQGTIVVE